MCRSPQYQETRVKRSREAGNAAGKENSFRAGRRTGQRASWSRTIRISQPATIRSWISYPGVIILWELLFKSGFYRIDHPVAKEVDGDYTACEGDQVLEKVVDHG